MRRWILPVLGDRTVATIKPADVQQLVNSWKGKLAPSTIGRTYSTLRAVLNLAVDRELLLRSPARGTRLPSVPNVRRHVPTPDELVALADTHPVEYEAMVWLGAVLGLRWGEVAGLRVGRLDVLRATLEVSEQITRGRKGRTLTDGPKSAAGRRIVAVPRALMAAILGDHLAARGLTGADTEALVFVSPEGAPLPYSNWMRRVWHPACIAAGLGRVVVIEGHKRYSGIGFHDLRRANATALIADGVDLKTAQTRLGHSNPRLTLALYAQASEAGDRAAAVALGDRFLGSRQSTRGMNAGVAR